MKYVIVLMLFLLGHGLQADQRSEDPERSSAEVMMKEGRLMSVSLTLGNPIRIFVTGREEAKLDLSKMKLTVRRLHPYPQQELKVNKDGNFYIVVNRDLQSNALQELEVTTSVYKASESFNFKINNQKP
ncbi:hypothetical protein [Pseudobdellovibrio sp. HCB154]|uniref:hypothetical protein n=1 Tax=Pseudobdellovibrio sp. HCB154 TaxID=3386277 RepID=UPI0039170503